jgi:ParB-like chromosome segregation protein Spo0J
VTENPLPALSSHELEQLRADVEAHGVRVPIEVCAETGEMLDGWHRRQVADDLGVDCPTSLVAGLDTDAARLAYRIRVNVNRRQLSPEQRAVLHCRQVDTARALRAEGRSQAEIAALIGVPRETVRNWLAATDGQVANGCVDLRLTTPRAEWARIVDDLDAGATQDHVAAEFKVTRQAIGKGAARERARRAEHAARQAVYDRTVADADGPGWKLLHGDLEQRLAELDPGCVDLIVTDPPYSDEALPLWSTLARVAAHVLRPGGILCALTGNIRLPEVIAALGEHLSYCWQYAQPLPGSNTRILRVNVLQTWKPWLAYSNGPWPSGRVDWHPDTLDPSVRAKDRYRWQQGGEPAGMLVDALTDPDGLVCDPFCGTGTYGAVALKQGRRFLGVELDHDRFAGAAASLRELAP